MRVQLDNTKQNLYICAKRARLKNYSCFETDFWEDFSRIRLTFFLPTCQLNNFYIEDFVYVLVICETACQIERGIENITSSATKFSDFKHIVGKH